MAAAKFLFVAFAIVASFSGHTVLSRGLIADANAIDHWIAGKHVRESTGRESIEWKKNCLTTLLCALKKALYGFGENSLSKPDYCHKYDCRCVVGDYCTPNSSIPNLDPNPVIDDWIEHYWEETDDEEETEEEECEK